MSRSWSMTECTNVDANLLTRHFTQNHKCESHDAAGWKVMNVWKNLLEIQLEDMPMRNVAQDNRKKNKKFGHARSWLQIKHVIAIHSKVVQIFLSEPMVKNTILIVSCCCFSGFFEVGNFSKVTSDHSDIFNPVCLHIFLRSNPSIDFMVSLHQRLYDYRSNFTSRVWKPSKEVISQRPPPPHNYLIN